MAIMHLDDSQVASAVSAIQRAITTCESDLKSLQAQIDNFLHTGLNFPQTSAALENSYATYNTNLNKMVDNLTSFSNEFTAIQQSLHEMDSNIASKINASK